MKNLLIIIVLTLFVSCGPLKKIRDRTSITKETEITETSRDSIKILETTKEINEKASVKVPESNTGDKDFDEAVDRAVTNILNAVNIRKTSGDNYLNMYFDEKERRMVLEARIAETQNSEIVVSSDTKTERTFDQQVEEITTKIKRSYWTYILLFVLLWPSHLKPILMPIFRMVTGPTNIVSGVKNMIKSNR